MKSPEAGENQREVSERQIRAELKRRAYQILRRPYDKDEIEVDGQKIELPFSNMSGVEVLLKSENGEWKYIVQRTGNDFEDRLKIIYESREG